MYNLLFALSIFVIKLRHYLYIHMFTTGLVKQVKKIKDGFACLARRTPNITKVTIMIPLTTDGRSRHAIVS
jgi:hypothetical protein